MEWFKAAVDAASAVLPPSVTKDLNEFVDTVARDATAALQRDAEGAPQQRVVDPDAIPADVSVEAHPLGVSGTTSAPALKGSATLQEHSATTQSTFAAAEQAVHSDDLPGWDDDEEEDSAARAVQAPAAASITTTAHTNAQS